MQSLRTLRSLPRFTSARAFSTTSPRNLAKMQLIGRLADAPEMTPTASGREITRFALGVSTGPKDENGNRGVSWFNVASFIEGPQRDFLLGLQKGSLIHVEADARMDSYQAQDGTNRKALNLVMRNFEALVRPRETSDEAAPAAAAGSA